MGKEVLLWFTPKCAPVDFVPGAVFLAIATVLLLTYKAIKSPCHQSSSIDLALPSFQPQSGPSVLLSRLLGSVQEGGCLVLTQLLSSSAGLPGISTGAVRWRRHNAIVGGLSLRGQGITF